MREIDKKMKRSFRKKSYCFSLLLVLFGAVLVGVPSHAKILLNKKSVSLYVGKSKQLKIKGTKKKIKWSSKNKKIATVTKKGKVVGRKAGKTVIVAKVSKKKFKCNVTVRNNASKKIENTESSGDTTNTEKIDAGEYSLKKIHEGMGTWYVRTSGGAANLDYMEKEYNTVAMNHTDYMNGLAGAYIEITDKDGDRITAVVTDRLPEGAKGDVDLSQSTFEKIESLKTGKMKISWKILPLPTKDPISYVFKPTSTEYWAEIQVRNHRYPIAKFEYYDKAAKKYIALPRQEYNYFTASSGMGKGPYMFRVTDIYGHVLVDKNIEINDQSEPILGGKNFPY